MIRVALVIVTSLAIVSCGGKKESEDKGTNNDACRKALALDLVRAQRAVDEGVGGAPPQMRDRLRADGEAEIALEREHFVEVCRGMAKFDLACYEDAAKAETDACKEQGNAMWEGVLKFK